MKSIKILLLVLLVSAVFYFTLWPVAMSPEPWDAPKNEGYSGKFSSNTLLSSMVLLDMGSDYGPEDFAINTNGDVATSSHSGFILLKKPDENGFTRWVNTQGRPLGIEYDHEGNLIVADAMKGLLQISPDGKIQTLVSEINGRPLVFADDVDIAPDGTIYFTDATSKFSPAEHGGTLSASMLEIFEHAGNGRVIAYSPLNGQITVLAENLVFANGITLSHDNRSLLVNETGKYRVLRIALSGEHRGRVHTLIDNLPGFPDNITAANDSYLVGLASPRSEVVDALSNYPSIRSMVQRLPSFMRPSAKAYGHLIRIDDDGNVLQTYQDPSGSFPLVTGALETDSGLYISSLTAKHVGFLALP